MTNEPDEHEAFRGLYRRTYPALHAYVTRRIPLDEAPDVLAEVFATAWQRRDRIPDPPLPWLYRVAANHLAHQRRGASRRWRLADRAKASPAPVVADHAEAVCGRLDDAALVRSLIARLPEADAEVLRLWAWEGLEPVDLAVVLGCTPGAARVRLHRAKGRISALLDNNRTPIVEEIR